MTVRQLMTLALTGALCLGSLAACGGDDDESVTTPTEAAEGSGDRAGTAAATSEGDEGGATGGDVAQWCTTYDALEGIDFSFDEAGSAVEVEATLDTLNTGLDDLLESSPDEVRDDVEQLSGFFGQLQDAAEASDFDLAPLATNAELEAAFTGGEFDRAGQNIDAFYQANCT